MPSVSTIPGLMELTRIFRRLIFAAPAVLDVVKSRAVALQGYLEVVGEDKPDKN